MKSLILKDLYNIIHNGKSMLFILVVFAFIILPISDVYEYIFVCAILCSTMILTTFTFDDSSNWNRYAMITPISKKDLVAGKFVVLFLFCTVGTVIGLLFGAAGGMIMNKVMPTSEGWSELLFLALIALAASVVLGSMSIPLVLRFGAEKGRLLLLVSFFVPVVICYSIYRLLSLSGIDMSDMLVFVLLCCSPVFALLWSYIMYKISCVIFERKEL